MKKSFFSLLLGISLSIIGLQLEKVQAVPLYSWETPQATPLPNGDLQWAPLAFKLVKGATVRYIDFDAGNDNNNGQSTSSAWKHHPWDSDASGNAKSASGIITYIFKRGVVYRGNLNANSSGNEGDPIRLTSDPAWGSGEAAIYGSVKITNGWTKGSSSVSPNIPNGGSVWYKSVSGLEESPKCIAEVTSSGIKRVYLARTPNYVNTPNEPQQAWWDFTAKVKNGNGSLSLTDTKNMTSITNANYFNGGDLWAIEDVITMCTLWRQRINSFNLAAKTLTVSDQNFGGVKCKYYAENTPYMLDAPGEYYYDGSRLFIRLEGDKDPNTTTIEVASKSKLIDINSKNNIDISGLTFGFTTYNNTRFGYEDAMPTIKLSSSSNITIKNCKFQYLNGGVITSGNSTNFAFTDNEMIEMADFGVYILGPDEIAILRNKVTECGMRHLGRWYSSIPTFAGEFVKVGEIAGNIMEHLWGSAINFTWGKSSSSSETIPFIRGLIHHNKVVHSLQGVNDYGGIESWQGGPVYCYNNISNDAQGWKYEWADSKNPFASLGFAYYFDGGFKQIVFNNLSSGRGHKQTAAAYNQVLGFYNVYAQNMAYNISSFSGSGDGALSADGYNYFLGNVIDSVWRPFNHRTIQSGIPYESFANNVFCKVTEAKKTNGDIVQTVQPFMGVFLTGDNTSFYDFSGFQNKLVSLKAEISQLGFEASRRVFENSSGGDFRPTEASEVMDRGVKFFVPFSLSRVVGEWNFLKHKADSTIIKGENFYFTSSYNNRETYKNVAKNNLKAYGLKVGSFVVGDLEDFTTGALDFDGSSTYCSAANNVVVSNNMNPTTSNFIIEMYFKTAVGHKDGVLLSKSNPTKYIGYQLDVNSAGKARFTIFNAGTSEYTIQSNATINDGAWHHVLVEVNRASKSATIFVDGVASNGGATGSVTTESINNTSNVLIGKNENGNFFKGTVDFVRISLGTLAEAKTTIQELYKWQFDGPFKRDFTGKLPIGKRDAGPIEKGAKQFNMVITPNPVYIPLGGGTRSFTINSECSFEVVKKVGSFIEYTVNGNTVNVTLPVTTSVRSGEIYINGCNETQIVKIIQQDVSAVDNINNSEISILPNPVLNNQITVILPDGIQKSIAKFIDLNGKVMLVKTVLSGENIITLPFSKGLYLLNIVGSDVNYSSKVVVL